MQMIQCSDVPISFYYAIGSASRRAEESNYSLDLVYIFYYKIFILVRFQIAYNLACEGYS